MKQHRSVPVAKGNIYTIDILRLGSSGEGVGRYENFTVFVRGALPGETVQAKIDVVKKQYATAILQDIITPSPQRVEPLCPVYAQCGGCQLQHMSYDGELQEKQGQVRDALERIGHLTGIDVLPTLGAATPWEYRNKMQFPAAAAKGKAVVGCYAAGSHRVIDVASCAIQKAGNNDILRIVRQWMNDYHVPAYNEQTHTGVVRHVMGRVGVRTGELMVCLVTAQTDVPHAAELRRTAQAYQRRTEHQYAPHQRHLRPGNEGPVRHADNSRLHRSPDLQHFRSVLLSGQQRAGPAPVRKGFGICRSAGR